MNGMQLTRLKSLINYALIILIVLIGIVTVLLCSRNERALKKGNRLLENGDFIGARNVYERIIARNPENFSAHYGLGMSWCAETIYKTELHLAEPEDWYPAIYHMTIAMNMKEHRQVQETLAILHFNLGACFKKRNDYATAIKLFEQAVAYNPGLLKALNMLGALYHERKNFSKAEYYYKQAIAVQPDYAMAHFNLGALAWARQDYQKAAESFRKAAELEPDNSYFQNWLIKAQEHAGNH